MIDRGLSPGIYFLGIGAFHKQLTSNRAISSGPIDCEIIIFHVFFVILRPLMGMLVLVFAMSPMTQLRFKCYGCEHYCHLAVLATVAHGVCSLRKFVLYADVFLEMLHNCN